MFPVGAGMSTVGGREGERGRDREERDREAVVAGRAVGRGRWTEGEGLVRRGIGGRAQGAGAPERAPEPV